MISIILPARNEPFLQKTIDDLLLNAEGEIEIIAVLDGYWPSPQLKDDPRVVVLHRGASRGMRASINSAAAIAKGEFLLKLDAHCMVGKGFDTILAAECEDNWVVVPRRKRLDAENWCLVEDGRPDIDYMYLSAEMKGELWEAKNRDPKLKEVLIDDLMSAQGSCWFMKKSYFYELELMDETNYGSFWNEFQEVGLKCWLSGGRVVVNKKTWYAHLHKKSRGYNLDTVPPKEYLDKWKTMGEAWHKQTLPLSWLYEKFNPPVHV